MSQLEFNIEKSDAKPFLQTKDRTNMWQKNDKGAKYKGQYFYNQGERVIVLIGPPKTGQKKPHMVTAESWQMLKKAGWKKV